MTPGVTITPLLIPLWGHNWPMMQMGFVPSAGGEACERNLLTWLLWICQLPSLSLSGVLFAAFAVKDGRSVLLILQWQQEGDAAELVAWLGCRCMGTNVLTWHFHAHIFFETLDRSPHARRSATHLTLYSWSLQWHRIMLSFKTAHQIQRIWRK